PNRQIGLSHGRCGLFPRRPCQADYLIPRPLTGVAQGGFSCVVRRTTWWGRPVAGSAPIRPKGERVRPRLMVTFDSRLARTRAAGAFVDVRAASGSHPQEAFRGGGTGAT